MTYTAHEENKIIPSGIDAVEEQSTQVAVDNFDCFVYYKHRKRYLIQYS